MSQETEQYDQLPDALVERLRARERSLSVLTPAVDRAVLEAAREQFAPRRRRNAAVRRWQIPAAAAAAVALVALFIARPFAPDELAPAGLADDVDGSGRVDVLDVFALARTRARDPDAVSQERIEALTARVVRLNDTETAL